LKIAIAVQKYVAAVNYKNILENSGKYAYFAVNI